jgi:hypothetical protein
MSPAALRSALGILGWSTRHLARILGLPERTPSEWTAGRYAMPAEYSAWLQRRLAAHEQAMRDDPPPAPKGTAP